MARIMTITRSGMTPESIEELISRRNGDDNDNGSGRNGNHGNNNGDGNQNEGNGGARRNALVAKTIKVYSPRNEIQKLENELWNLCVKGTDVASYMRRFQELTLLCPIMVPKENEKIKRFIWGLPDNIQGVLSKRGSSITTHRESVYSSYLSRGRTWLKLSWWAIVRRE
ncbi:reverse transcriptase domain-containing protein, partial [Tanacetum coccineum]